MNEIRTIRPGGDVPQHSIEAEQQVLGALLVNNALIYKIPALKSEHFYDPFHGRLFDHIQVRCNAGKLASPVTAKLAFEKDPAIEQLGGAGYLARLAGSAMATFAIADYAEIIIGTASARLLDLAAQEARKAISEGKDPEEVVSSLQEAIYAVPRAKGPSSFSLLSSVTDSIVEMNRAFSGEQEIFKTGITPLDKIIGGLKPTDMCVFGAAPSMGKTTLLIDAAVRAAEAGKRVLFVSAEMSRSDLANRIISSKSRIPYEQARAAGDMDEATFRKWVDFAQKVGELPIRITPDDVRDIASIRAAIKSSERDFGGKPDLIVLDYGQLLTGTGNNRFDRMSSIPTDIKMISKQMHIPTIPAVQLSRDLGGRTSRRPLMRDIKESGQWEQDADQIVFCHREHYWIKQDGPQSGKDGKISAEAIAEWEADMAASENKMELIVSKNRHGRTGVAHVSCHMPTNRLWWDSEAF